MAEIALERLTKVYPDGTKAVIDLDLEVGAGEFVVFVGPSGCGKTTALRMVAGLETITSGNVRIDGQVVNDLPPKNRDIAMVFQNYALYPHMTASRNMGFALKMQGVPRAEIDRRVREAGRILGLTDSLQKKPRTLSGGQRQRVAMGRAIVRNPQAFLMDEPLSNLDAKLRVEMRAEIARIQRDLAVTTVYVTHDQIEAMTMGDRVAVLKRGRLQQVDSPQALYERPDNLFVAGFIGSPAMNLGRAAVVDHEGQLSMQFDETSDVHLADAALERYPRVRDYVGREVAVGMRPEHFYRADASTPAETTMKGCGVRLVELLGSEVLVHFTTGARPVITEDLRDAMDDEEAFAELEHAAEKGGQQFVARLEPHEAPKSGQTVDLGFKTEHMHFFDIDNGQALR